MATREELTAAITEALDQRPGLSKADIKAVLQEILEPVAGQPADMPSVSDFLQHCSTCPAHKQELDRFVEQVRASHMEDLGKDPAGVKALARKQGWYPPKPIEIELGGTGNGK